MQRSIAFRAVPFETLSAASIGSATALFFQAPYDHAGPGIYDRLAPLRAAFPDMPIAFFDWAAPADMRFASSVAPFVDHYVKKAFMRDRGFYLLPRSGHTNLTDHYSIRFGTENPLRDWSVPSEILDRLDISPAFSTGSSLIARFEKNGPPMGPRPIDLHARIATKGTPWYQAMRTEAKEAVSRHFGDLQVASDGFVAPKKYLQELSSSKICFSPFGYGEVCWRDFEAAALGAVMVKPDMSHLETNPDIYRPFETYVPVRWDLSDLEEKVRALLAKPAERQRIADNAFRVARDHLRGNHLEQLVDRLLMRAAPVELMPPAPAVARMLG